MYLALLFDSFNTKDFPSGVFFSCSRLLFLHVTKIIFNNEKMAKKITICCFMTVRFILPPALMSGPRTFISANLHVISANVKHVVFSVEFSD